MLSEHFERHNVNIHYDENGTFICNLGRFLLLVHARENEPQVLCHCVARYRCPKEALGPTALFIARMNDRLSGSWWSLETEDGLLTHNTSILACDNDLSDEQIKRTVSLAISGTVTMFPFIQAIGEEEVEPTDALKLLPEASNRCENAETPEDNPKDDTESDETWDVATVDGSKLVH